MRDVLVLAAKILALLFVLVVLPVLVYGDPRCIVAECRIVK